MAVPAVTPDRVVSRPVSLAARAFAVVSMILGLIVAMVAADLSGVAFFLAFGGTGAYLVALRPRNSVGWLLMLIGWGLVLGTVVCTVPLADLESGDLDLAQALTAWANGCGWTLAFIGFFGISQVFPTGRWPIGSGRWARRIGLAGTLILAATIMFGPTLSVTIAATGLGVDVPNPFLVAPSLPFWRLIPGPEALYFLMFGFLVIGIAGLVVRARQAVGLERLQYRWLVAAIVFAAVVNLAWAVGAVILRTDSRGLVSLVVLLGYVMVPLAIVIAITRYRLFDIDRIISRTIAYGAVLAVLATVFGAGVLVLSSALASFAAQAESIAVAASTLLTYAVLQPVVVRIRRDVDRRFDRTRYDAEQTVQAFAVRLRHETNVEAVTRDLATTTQAVVAPTSTSLWLRASGRTR